MNPARSFGPALYTGNWANQWIYWVAPLSAALITSVAFKLIFHREVPKPLRQVDEIIPLRDNKNNV